VWRRAVHHRWQRQHGFDGDWRFDGNHWFDRDRGLHWRWVNGWWRRFHWRWFNGFDRWWFNRWRLDGQWRDRCRLDRKRWINWRWFDRLLIAGVPKLMKKKNCEPEASVPGGFAVKTTGRWDFRLAKRMISWLHRRLPLAPAVANHAQRAESKERQTSGLRRNAAWGFQELEKTGSLGLFKGVAGVAPKRITALKDVRVREQWSTTFIRRSSVYIARHAWVDILVENREADSFRVRSIGHGANDVDLHAVLRCPGNTIVAPLIAPLIVDVVMPEVKLKFNPPPISVTWPSVPLNVDEPLLVTVQ
jgi:hypothetical protein